MGYPARHVHFERIDEEATDADSRGVFQAREPQGTQQEPLPVEPHSISQLLYNPERHFTTERQTPRTIARHAALEPLPIEPQSISQPQVVYNPERHFTPGSQPIAEHAALEPLPIDPQSGPKPEEKMHLFLNEDDSSLATARYAPSRKREFPGHLIKLLPPRSNVATTGPRAILLHPRNMASQPKVTPTFAETTAPSPLKIQALQHRANTGASQPKVTPTFAEIAAGLSPLEIQLLRRRANTGASRPKVTPTFAEIAARNSGSSSSRRYRANTGAPQ